MNSKRLVALTWQAGREQGLIAFCQPLRGFRVGESGGYYDGACNSNLEPAFWMPLGWAPNSTVCAVT